MTARIEPSLAEFALLYALRGWHVFPLAPHGKTPATRNGFYDATTDRERIRAWWTENPEYNIGIRTGEVSGLYVLDLDAKPGRGWEEILRELPPIPETPTVKTGSGGVHYYFAFPAGADLSISGGKLGKGVDTRGNGGYVVAPGSIHPNGTVYTWWEFDDRPLAPTPTWIIERLERQKATAVISSAAEKLTGGRHDTLMTAAALMRGIGLVPAEILPALSAMVNRLDLSDGRVIAAKELRDIAEWTGDKNLGTVNIESIMHGEAVAASLLSSMGEAAREVAVESIASPGAFPTDLLRVPGVVGDLCAYINAVSLQEQPNLALGASLAAFGALIGRKVESVNGARSNLYVVGVCDSGGGKDSARQAIKRAFHAAGADAVLGPEELASDAGLVKAVELQPSLVFLLDEIGRLLRTMGDPKSAPHLYGIATTLMKLYSSAASVWRGKAYADPKQNPLIDQPNACLYGTTVPDSLYAALTTENVTDGLLSRFLMVTSDDHYPAKKRRRGDTVVPERLLAALRHWDEFKPGGNLSASHPEPLIVDRTADAQAVFDGMDEMVRQERTKAGKTLGALWTRVEQKADQLSIIYACSRGGLLVVDGEAARWARDLAVYVTRRMVYDAGDRIAENATEATSKRIGRLIREAGADGLTKWELGQRSRFLGRREREDVIAALLEQREIVVEVIPTGKKPRTVYRSSTYRTEVSNV